MEAMRGGGVFFLVCGGILYPSLEILYRGHTHPSMALAGALCGVLLYYGNTLFPHRSFLFRTLLGAFAILLVEFIIGVVCNLFLGLSVWDYSGEPYHLLGQICLRYALFWVLLSGVLALVISRLMHEIRERKATENF